MRKDIFGYFDKPEQTSPAHDPGLTTICPICVNTLSAPLMTISLMPFWERERSYFFRVHKSCWNQLNDDEKNAIEGSLIDELAQT